MAEYEERNSEDLTEEASPYRLEEMRQKGQVAQSKDLTGAVAFLVSIVVVQAVGKSFVESTWDLMRMAFSFPLQTEDVTRKALYTGFGLILPLFAAVVVGVVTISVLQTGGFLFTTETLKVDLERISPMKGLGKIFSRKSLFEMVKSVVKAGVLTLILYKATSSDLVILSKLNQLAMNQIVSELFSLTWKVILTVGISMLALSGIDYWFQWMEFRKQAMLTKPEAKREAKEREGDPQIKARIRSVQREMARKRMMKAVPKADVIVTNPTHFAVALVYDKEMLAPRVIAKGADFLALRIKDIAKEHNIPVVENRPVAQALYKTVKVGQMIPRSMYKVVAEILAFVYRLKPKVVLSEHEDQ